MNRRRKWLLLAAVAAIPLVGLGIAWGQRSPIAQSVIDGELEKRGVQASYELKAVGTKRQRIENIVIGDTARPDMTVEWAEIDTSLSLFGAEVKAVRAGGVRLLGRTRDGKPSFGEVDKLLPKPTGEPFSFPNIELALTNAVVGLATEQGNLGLHVSGKGNPATDFSGKLGLVSPALRQKDCAVRDLRAYGDLTLKAGAPAFTGPLNAQSLACAGVSMAGMAMRADLQSTAQFDGLSGNVGIKAKSLKGSGLSTSGVDLELNGATTPGFRGWTGTGQFKAAAGTSGDMSLRQIDGSFDFDGTRNSTKGAYRLTAAQVSSRYARLGGIDARGDYGFGDASSGGFRLRTAGSLEARQIVPDRSLLARVSGFGGGGTPVGPIVDKLKAAVVRLGAGGSGKARYAIEQTGGRGEARLTGVSFDAASQAKLRLGGEAPILYSWPSGGLKLYGTATLAGGGFPQSEVRFDGNEGTATIAPMSAGGSRLALTPIRYRFGGGGLALDTVATLDGSIGAGRVRGLTLPVSLRPGASPLAGCLKPRYESLQIGGLSLSGGQIDGCFNAKEAIINAPSLNGRLGNSPIALKAKRVRFSYAKGDFTADGLSIKLMNDDKPTLLDVASVQGSLSAGNAKGSYKGASGQIGAVPLLLSQGEGHWQFANGAFATNASLTVADREAEPRFYPLVSNDFALRFANDRITANGSLRAPQNEALISQVDIVHSLSSGNGRAVLDVPGLTFSPTLQPDQLTPITKGVIANVDGALKGRGQIDWTPKDVRSSGGFRTEGMDLAAAFGPVYGIRGEVSLSDLLGLETPPGQVVKIASINPGIPVSDGEIHYRLLPGLRVEIEGGRWPYAGGSLILEPSILDLNQATARYLTFRMEGLDVARFISAMEFQNIAATGIFDGTLPMVFDKDGGRIEGGMLVARGGGTLSYIGEISNENIGSMGRFAFDALKSIKYDRLSIDLNGALDGDVITRIAFSGVNQAPIEGVRAKFPLPVKVTGLTNIPFIFNITITAKFRQLFETVRSFNDPSNLINRMIPELESMPKEQRPASNPPVQPPASRKQP